MMKKGKPTGGTVGSEGNDNSQLQYNVQTAIGQGPIECVLRSLGAIGRDHAVTREQVARALGLSSQDGSRTVSKMLEKERAESVICSCGTGLFVPEESDKGDLEVIAYISEVSRKGAGSFKSIKGARRYIQKRQRRKTGQIEISEVRNE